MYIDLKKARKIGQLFNNFFSEVTSSCFKLSVVKLHCFFLENKIHFKSDLIFSFEIVKKKAVESACIIPKTNFS